MENIENINKKQTTNASSPPDGDEAALCNPEIVGNKKRSVGNKIFDWGVYGSVAWIGVAAFSLITAHEAKFGKNRYFNWLRELETKLEKGVYNTLSSTVMKNSAEKDVKSWSEGVSLFGMLGLGGTTLMAPIKWLEDNRLKIATKIDHLLGTTPPEEAKAEPKQTWGSVLSGRAASLAISFGAFALMGPKITNKISTWFGNKATNAWLHMRPKSHVPTVKKWADLVAFDALFTCITASITYAFSRFVAKRIECDKRSDAIAAATDAQATAPADQNDDEKSKRLFADNELRPAPINKNENFQSALLAQQERSAAAALAL